VRRGSASIGLLKAVLVTLVGTTLLAGGVIYGGTGPSSIGVVMVCLLAGAGGSILAFVVSSVNGTDAPPSKVLRAHLFALVGFLVTYILSIAVWALTGSETAAIIGAIAALLLILLAVSSSVVVVFRLLLNKPAPRI
jgi:hypothetical protein